MSYQVSSAAVGFSALKLMGAGALTALLSSTVGAAAIREVTTGHGRVIFCAQGVLRMKGYQQGHLDGLCGVYAVVNALRLVKGGSAGDAAKLFEAIIRQLDKDKRLADIIIDGMNSVELRKILRQNEGEEAVVVKMPFKGRSMTLEEYWAETSEFIADGRVVIVGLSGVHEHWTVIQKMSDAQITLHDSDDLVHLNRGHCTTGDPTVARMHRLHPAQTFIVAKAPE